MSARIKLEMLKEDPNLQGFSCGVNSIDIQVQNIYYAMCLCQGIAYQIQVNNIICGYMFLTPSIIRVKEPDYESELMHNTYPVIYVKFIAVNRKYQGHGIGKEAMDLLMRRVREWHQIIPFRYLVIDALIERVAFYNRLGFSAIDLSERDQYKTTEWMKIDLIDETEADRLQQFLDDEIE